MWSYRLVRIILATIFLWSGLAKLIDPASLCSYYRSLRADSGKLDHADSCRFTRFRDSLSYRPVAGYQRKSHHHYRTAVYVHGDTDLRDIDRA